jgi:hypothetical protein
MNDNSDITSTHSNDLGITRTLVTTLIRAVQDEIVSPALCKKEIVSNTALWGEKENAVSVLVKLTGLLLKLIPLEREITGKSTTPPEEEESGELNEEDRELLRRYVERVAKNS